MQSNQKLILIRGLSGSGKSTLAEKLKSENPTWTGPIEADSFFMNYEVDPPVYLWKSEFLSEAHQFCYAVAAMHLSRGSTVIVSNTFTTAEEIARYAQLAIKCRVPYIEIQEPETEWKRDVTECFKKNRHRVPIGIIENQAKRWFLLATGLHETRTLRDFLKKA